MTLHTIIVVPMLVKMWFVKYHVLILCLIVFNCYALNCRSDGGPKEAELKNIYKKCLKMQEGKSSNSNRSDLDWRERREHNENNDWDRDRLGKDRTSRSDTTNSRDRNDKNGRSDDRDDYAGDNNKRSDSYDNDRRSGSYSDRMGSDKRAGRNERNEMMSNNDRYGREDYFNNRGDFARSDEFGDGMTQYNYYSSEKPPRRYKREKRLENSGHRSQYNPNTHKITGYEGYRSDDKNSSENNSSKETDNKACALHCFLETLEMTGEDGMPDRYLVTQTITKDVKNEDLRDFLQESIEECFQLLNNENTDDKCDFSQKLLMCLSEKGRANCDDWKDDLKF